MIPKRKHSRHLYITGCRVVEIAESKPEHAHRCAVVVIEPEAPVTVTHLEDGITETFPAEVWCERFPAGVLGEVAVDDNLETGGSANGKRKGK
jgi:hypothetical protein